MTDYAWGVLTPFIAIAGLALAIGVAYLLAAAARHLWGKTNYALMGKTTLRRNRPEYDPSGTSEAKPEYLDAANTFRDALLESPVVRTVAALGWRVLVVRDTTDRGEK